MKRSWRSSAAEKKKMASRQNVGFWRSVFPNQLGNLCFVLFLVGLALVVAYAAFDLNVFDPNCFKSTDDRIPELGTRRVVDEAGVLTQDEINALTAQIDVYEAASGGQMAVLIIRSLYGDAVEDFSLAVAEKWKIGWQGKDNGVLLLLAMDDRESRLEIGYGLEGVINDARSGDILRDMAPYMRKGEYAQAISFVISSVSAFVLHENGPDAPGEDDEEEEESDGTSASTLNPAEDTLFSLIGLLIFIQIFGTILARSMIHPSVKRSIGLAFMIGLGLLILQSFLAALKGGGSGGGRGGGSSRSGGGGGGFGGGGASGKW